MDYLYIFTMLLAGAALADYSNPEVLEYDYDDDDDADYYPTEDEISHDIYDDKGAARIVGGEAVNITEYPSMLYMRIKYKYQSGGCGASIISSKWVLTAAHCCIWHDGPKDDAMKVLFQAGSSSTTKIVSVHKAVDYIVYEDYHKERTVSMNDIALLMVEPEFSIDGVTIDVARLPEPGKFVPLPDQVGTVIGFGRLVEYGKQSKFLQKVDLVITDKEFCQKNYVRIAPIINDDMICTTGGEQFKGFCDGDSGGPLFVDDELVGVVSWSGRPCGKPTKPSVFTRISSFRDWIRNKTGI